MGSLDLQWPRLLLFVLRGGDMSLIQIAKIDWSYRKCEECWRMGKSHWMHGTSSVTKRMESVTGDYCPKHEHVFRDRLRAAFGAGVCAPEGQYEHP